MENHSGWHVAYFISVWVTRSRLTFCDPMDCKGSSGPRDWAQVSDSLPSAPPGSPEELVPPSCLTLCDPMDYSPSGSSAHGVLQGRILEWVAIPCSRGSSRPRDGTQVSCTAGRLFPVWATRVSIIKTKDLSHCSAFKREGIYVLPTFHHVSLKGKWKNIEVPISLHLRSFIIGWGWSQGKKSENILGNKCNE